MTNYEAPRLTRIGTVADLTQGQLFREGQDFLSWIPIVGDLFGNGPRPHPPGGGGGFGS